MVVFLLYTVISLFITWPLVLNLNDLIIDRFDGLLITWIMNWNIFHLGDLNANIFYPYQSTLAFSDFHLLGSLVAVPFVRAFGEPLLAYNINFLLGFILPAFGTYLLVYHLTKKSPISFFAGILFSFSTIHLNYMAHLQLFSLWPVILATLFLLKNKFKLFVLFFWLSSLNSPLNFYFLLLIGLMLRRFRYLFFAGVVTIPFLLPYYFVSHQFNYVRPINDAIHFSLQFPDLVNISASSRLYSFFHLLPGTPAYFGAVFFALCLILLTSIRQCINIKATTRWIWIAALSFVLALGPALHIFRNTVHVGPIPVIPLPYAILYFLIPGFSGFRTPSRWILLAAFALTVTIAVYLSKLISWRWAVLLSALVIIEINFPLKYVRVPKVSEFPPEQIWLKDHYVGAPIIQFPIYGWFDGENIGLETMREYYSTTHWHPMYNGYSGFSPKEWEVRVKWLQKNFPNQESIAYLRNQKIKLVLAPLEMPVPLKLVATFPNTKIYEID